MKRLVDGFFLSHTFFSRSLVLFFLIIIVHINVVVLVCALVLHVDLVQWDREKKKYGGTIQSTAHTFTHRQMLAQNRPFKQHTAHNTHTHTYVYKQTKTPMYHGSMMEWTRIRRTILSHFVMKDFFFGWFEWTSHKYASERPYYDHAQWIYTNLTFSLYLKFNPKRHKPRNP